MRSEECPETTGHTWRYYNGYSWRDANDDIEVVEVNCLNITTRPCDINGKSTNWQTAGNEHCCSNGGAGFCAEGEGDCDGDNECQGDLVCGNNNCPWGDGDDCCTTAGEEQESNNGDNFLPKFKN